MPPLFSDRIPALPSPQRRTAGPIAMAKIKLPPTVSIHARGVLPNPWDADACVLVMGLLALVAHAAHEMTIPLAVATSSPISLDPHVLPEYALRTTLRMILALLASLLFPFTYATLAAKV